MGRRAKVVEKFTEYRFPSMSWRAKIALIIPPSGYNFQCEFHKMVPTGVGIITTCIPLESATPESLIKMEDHVEEAAKLMTQGYPDLIVFGCTSGSLVMGPGSDLELAKRIEKAAETPALVTSTAVVNALKKLKIKKLIVATPYIDEIDQLEKQFLGALGFEVLRIEGLGISDTQEIVGLRPELWYRFVKEIYTPKCDGIFISCTGIHTMNIIESIEKDFMRPVVTSTQATIWAALNMLGIKKSENGVGKLFCDA